jgi:FtsP/CotA-like multicopper oxidase with cupredoxin domain
MNRRTAIAAIATGGTAALAATRFATIRGRTSITVPRFELPLKIPATLKPVRQTENQDEYEIVQKEAEQEILPGYPTRIWGYEGLFPGPTIRVKRDRATVIRHTNNLPAHTVVHLHGGRTPADSDGFATDMVMPGEARTYLYPNQQRACTLWYHDHAMDRTGENVYRGLAGFYIIEDDEERSLPLPKGSFDVPLLLQDRVFSTDGSLRYNSRGHSGAEGDVMLANGVPWPRMEVSTRKYRFRILNGSNARVFQLALSNGDPFILIGTDGGLLAEPAEVGNLPLAMAERGDVVIDFARVPLGTKLFLLNTRERPENQLLIRFDVIRQESDDASIPPRLSNPGFLRHEARATRRTWTLRPTFSLRHGLPPTLFTINGREFDADRVDARVPLGEIELWRFRNETVGPFFAMPHPAHVHLSHFRIVERNGRPPLIHERGWKDTVALENGDEVLIAVRFEQYRGRYMLHCHNLEHEDHAMMSRFDVV